MSHMIEAQHDEDEIRVAHLAPHHIGRRIRFRRPRTSPAGFPIITGQLIGVERQDIWRGNMRQLGYALTLAFPSKTTGYDHITYGPLPITYPIMVGPTWAHRPNTTPLPHIEDHHHRLRNQHRPDTILR